MLSITLITLLQISLFFANVTNEWGLIFDISDFIVLNRAPGYLYIEEYTRIWDFLEHQFDLLTDGLLPILIFFEPAVPPLAYHHDSLDFQDSEFRIAWFLYFFCRFTKLRVFFFDCIDYLNYCFWLKMEYILENFHYEVHARLTSLFIDLYITLSAYYPAEVAMLLARTATIAFAFAVAGAFGYFVYIGVILILEFIKRIILKVIKRIKDLFKRINDLFK